MSENIPMKNCFRLCGRKKFHFSITAVLTVMFVITNNVPANAGQIYASVNTPGSHGVHITGGYYSRSGISSHRAKISTAAQRALTPNLDSDRPIRLESSPSEAGVLQEMSDEEKYQQQYYKWQVQVAKIKQKAEEKRLADEKKKKKEELAALEKIKRKNNNGKINQSLAARRTSQNSSAAVAPSHPSEGMQTNQPRPSFWERLKRALFGS